MFNNKHILVVGASSGIGRQTAIQLSQLGAHLTMIARREKELQETIALLQGNNHSYYPFDFADIPNIGNIIKQIVSKHDKLDGVVYAAGVGDMLPLKFINYEKALHTFNINYFSFIECVKQVSLKNHYNKGLRIVAISSVAAIRGQKANTTYSASKAATDAAVRCLAVELWSKGIAINTVQPSMIKTEMYEAFIQTCGEDSEANTRLLQKQYAGIGEPEDVANAIIFLLSQNARYITGVSLPVDGGYTSY